LFHGIAQRVAKQLDTLGHGGRTDDSALPGDFHQGLDGHGVRAGVDQGQEHIKGQAGKFYAFSAANHRSRTTVNDQVMQPEHLIDHGISLAKRVISKYFAESSHQLQALSNGAIQAEITPAARVTPCAGTLCPHA
jgi:hypothetical protein